MRLELVPFDTNFPDFVRYDSFFFFPASFTCKEIEIESLLARFLIILLYSISIHVTYYAMRL